MALSVSYDRFHALPAPLTPLVGREDDLSTCQPPQRARMTRHGRLDTTCLARWAAEALRVRMLAASRPVITRRYASARALGRFPDTTPAAATALALRHRLV